MYEVNNKNFPNLIIDLLKPIDPNEKTGKEEKVNEVPYVQNLGSYQVHSSKETLQVYQQGMKNKVYKNETQSYFDKANSESETKD